MALTRTAPRVGHDDELSASTHRALILALDELFSARYNFKTPFAFDAQPGLALGAAFRFGSPAQNLISIAPAVYDPAPETPPPPTPVQVISYDATTKVVFVTGYNHNTLNRISVMWKPPTAPPTDPDTKWWIGNSFAGRPEQFEKRQVADIAIEGPTTWTWESHWDKYGCVRFHNGNRTELRIVFESGAPDLLIPPFGIRCGRRPAPDEPFEFDSYYLPLTDSEDFATWQATRNEGTAGTMQGILQIADTFPLWTQRISNFGYDSTSREQGSFTGAAPQATDRFNDWLVHRGKFLSVVLDKRDGAVTVIELEFKGVDDLLTNPWAGQVEAVLFSGPPAALYFTLSSEVTPPIGAAEDEWEHDLIPLSTNLFGTAIIPLKATPYQLNQPVGAAWEFFGEGIPFVTFYKNDLGFYGPPNATSNPALAVSGIGLTESLAPPPATTELQWLERLSHRLPTPPLDFGITQPEHAYYKTSAAIGHKAKYQLNVGDYAMLDVQFFDYVQVSGQNVLWPMQFALSVNGRRRFIAWHPRKFQPAGRKIDATTVAYDQHPQDAEVKGSVDGLALGQKLVVQPISASRVQIEGANFFREDTAGNTVWPPTDLLHRTLEKLEEPGWWLANRSRCIAGTLQAEDKMITWRIPRLIEEFNDVAIAINAIQAVQPVTIHHLHYLPAPAQDIVDNPAFGFFGETAWAVPAGWAMGLYESGAGTPLSTWAAAWSIPINNGVPSLGPLRSKQRTQWHMDIDHMDYGTPIRTGRFPSGCRIITDPPNPTPVETINGETYYADKAWTSTRQRQLFGGAGTDTGYVWVKEADLRAVFDPLGVAVPRTPLGERYQPKIVTDTGGHLVLGTFEGTAADLTEPLGFSGETTWRQPAPADGEWLAIFQTGEMFRLIDAPSPGGNRRVESYQHPLDLPPSPTFLIWEMDPPAAVDNDGLNNGQSAPRGLVPLQVDRATPVWRSAYSVQSSVAVRILVWQEPWWLPRWTDPGPTDPNNHTENVQDIQMPAVDARARILTIQPSQMPITADLLRDLLAVEWPCFHLTAWPLEGVRRVAT